MKQRSVLVIACGAIARELVRVRNLNDWDHVDFQCLPPELHNRPERIPGAVREKVLQNRDRYSHIFVGYADCGTGGALDRQLQELGIERIPGAHCYDFFSGVDVFKQLADEEPGSFYLTDFLARHFERLVIRGLGLDTNPELLPMYFGRYKRLVYLAQTRSTRLRKMAEANADRLGLEFHYHFCGDEPLAITLEPFLGKRPS